MMSIVVPLNSSTLQVGPLLPTGKGSKKTQQSNLERFQQSGVYFFEVGSAFRSQDILCFPKDAH